MKRLFLSLLFACALVAPLSAQRPPNIVIIMADDLGYGDLGCYGSATIKTPNLDRMAAEGLKFTDYYSGAPVCTPSRAALLTGRLPVRSGTAAERRRVFHHTARSGLLSEEVTIAEALKPKGYSTAIIGKWHLGHLPEYLPRQQGFDYYFGLPYSNDMNAATPTGPANSLSPKIEWWNVALMRNEQEIEKPVDQNTLTRRYTDEATRFIREHKNAPFFLYLPHTMPHVPLFTSDQFRGKSPGGLYGDVVEELDWSVGEILKCLREQGVAENTFVFFTSDNGPWLTQGAAGGSAGKLRDGKGSTWEGGMRVPAIASWPGKIKPGETRAIGSHLDLFNTSLALAGAPVPNDRVIDGVDLSPLLFGTNASPRDIFYYHRDTQLYAIRKGPWKAHLWTQGGYANDKKRHDPPLLFNLDSDIGEQTNVAAAHPEIARELKSLAEKHIAQLVPGENQIAKGLNVVKPQDDGTILLHSRDAIVHGVMLRYEPETNKITLGFWTKKEDWASWEFQVLKPGKYRVEALQGCGPRSGGSEVEFAVGDQKLLMTVQETRHFQDFIPRDLGTINFTQPGEYTLTVKPRTKPSFAVMDLRQVRLLPGAD